MEDSVPGREWNNRTKSANQVREKLRTGWKHDPAILNQYFESCYTNWKVYKGERTAKQVLKLQSIYKQAIYGDNSDPPPEEGFDSIEGQKWTSWTKLKGMPSEMAKRRFITYLAEINPLLIDVMPDEKPPPGFPLDRRGNPICAKCNTVVGCSRPLLDQFKMNLHNQLFENEEFHEPERLTLWIQNAIANQRCIWGVHLAVTKAETKPFMDWFNREENRGFYPYDSIVLMKIVHELVFHYHQLTYEMMKKKDEIPAEIYNAQAKKTLKLKEIFQNFASEEFIYELPCSNKESEQCNMRRAADGGRNHNHVIILDPPTYSDLNTMEEAIALRKQCVALGLNPCTGVVKNIVERCDIYRQRIATHFENLKKASEAKIRNEKRQLEHGENKKKVLDLSKDIMIKQCHEACNGNLIDQIRILMKRGCNPNEESSKGLTPLLTLIINEVAVEKIEELILIATPSVAVAASSSSSTSSSAVSFSSSSSSLPIVSKLDINLPNRYGITPLMLACRLKDTKIVHLLMKNGAIATQKGLNGMTALHMCVIHNYEEGIKVIVEYLKEGAGDAMRVIRFIESQDHNGDSALLYACRIRNGFMCSLLTSLGANPNNRNSIGRTAPYIARDNHWNEIADWLEKKASTGIKVETYSDQQFDKNTKLGHMRLRDLINQFGKTYLLLVQHRLGLYPLGCPFKIAAFVIEKGENALYEQQLFVDNHQKYLLNRLPSSYMIESQHFSSTHLTLKRKLTILNSKEIDSETAFSYLKQLKEIMTEIVNIIRQGFGYPDYETLPQPLAWTPLMCAIALNDIRSAKLLLKEGADPNYANRDGMTAMMLVSQLQGVEMLIELLQFNGNLTLVDNQGYSVLAYASSLPLPTIMNREIKDIFTNNDIYGPKLLSTQQIIEHILANYSIPVSGGGGGGLLGNEGGKGKVNYDFEELREMVRKNYKEIDSKKIDNYLKQNKLLELYGLTPIDNEHNLLHQVQSSQWRVKEGYAEKEEEEEEDEKGEDEGGEAREGGGDAGKKGKRNSFYTRKKQRKEDEEAEREATEKENEEDSMLKEIEEQMKKKYQQQEDAIKAEQKAKELSNDVLRCPICTLEVPCAHFLKIQSLMSFLNEKEGLSIGKVTKQGSISKDLIAYNKQFNKKLKIKNRSQEILDEAQIGDRHTDRSKTFAIGFQERERSLEKAFQQRIEEEKEEEELQELQEEERREIAMEELLDYPPSEYYYGSKVLKSPSASPVVMFPALPSPSSPSSSPTKLVILSRPPSFEGTNYDSYENSKPSTADSLVSRGILKPQSRGGDNGSFEERNIESPKKSRRVKFNLPDDSSIEEETERLAITDGSEYLQLSEQQLIEHKPQQVTTIENAFHVLQTGGEDDFQLVTLNDKKPSSSAVSEQKRRLMLFTKDTSGKATDGFTTTDETSYYRLPPKPSSSLKKQKRSSSPPLRPPFSSTSVTDPSSFSSLSAIEFVKELMVKQQRLRKPGKEERKKRIKTALPVKLKTSISGWIFVHSAKITSNIIPLESISFSQVGNLSFIGFPLTVLVPSVVSPFPPLGCMDKYFRTYSYEI
jgi:ankyrin repeat protein/acyl-CoA-binding protein